MLKICVVLKAEVNKIDDVSKQFGKNLCMHIAASKPLALDIDKLEVSLVEKEKDIHLATIKSSGKPDNIIKKILEGKMNKFFQENCLMEQAYIKDSEKKVMDLVTESVATLGENITISKYTRFAVGESDPSNGQI